jgi:hypothetical protein
MNILYDRREGRCSSSLHQCVDSGTEEITTTVDGVEIRW